ncbi:MAG TPA: MBL fold metallo-hydrolase [Vicinamibacterales bacterium]|nr:MBL fold metallo-hydrolase [Vicinamibacterales bacterium]
MTTFGHRRGRGLEKAALLSILAGVTAFAQQQPPPALETLRVQNNVHAIFGAGGNVTVQIGADGVLVVDSGVAASAAALAGEIRKLSNGPIRFLINTHLHADHTGGNVAFSRAATDPMQPLNIVANEHVLSRMSAALPPFQAGQTTGGAERLRGLPIDEYFTPSKDLRFNGEAVVLYHEANAHTDGDTVVLFRGSDVVSTGDVFTPDAYPFIDVANGGTIQGEIAALNHILQLTVPGHTQEGGTYVVPGHGRICDEADVVEFRDMLVIVRDRVRDMINKKMTLDQIKAARPTRDYDPGYVTPASFVKADQFVESVYKGLMK